MPLDDPPPGRTALVVYGSETGSAQDAAEELGRLAERLYFDTRVAALDRVSLGELVRYDVVLVAIATTGQGELPANARGFWRRLRSARLRPGCLARMAFASFGLGDSSYPQFNWAHRKLYNRLVQLGARAVCARGEGDERHPEGVLGAFAPWVLGLREKLLDEWALPPGRSPMEEDVFLMPKWRARVGGKDAGEGGEVDAAATPPEETLPNSFVATVTENKRLTPPTHWQDVRLFEFTAPAMPYAPGDVLTIYPHNDPADVDALLETLDWTAVADQPLTFEPTRPHLDTQTHPPPFPHPTTLRALIATRLDIAAVPRRSFFAHLAHFTADEYQRERLLEFTNPALVDELYDYTTRPRRSILEVLQEFDTVRIPHQWAAHVFPALRGRQFSIASGGRLKTGVDGRCCIQLLVAIVRYRTVIRKIRQGVCTRYMAALAPGQQLRVSLGASGMRPQLARPAVMVGPGTGVAPLRAMLHEQRMSGDSITNGESTASDNLLFIGARNQAADFFFADEWPALPGLRVVTAFSRDQPAKVYVQDRLREHGAAVYALLAARGGVLYVCGAAGKMPQAVREALLDVFQAQGGEDRAAAERRLLLLEKEGRYQQETW